MKGEMTPFWARAWYPFRSEVAIGHPEGDVKSEHTRWTTQFEKTYHALSFIYNDGVITQ